MDAEQPHITSFARVGKTYQLVLHNGLDLQDALNLDEALWAATSAPADAFRADPAFIALLDPNHTGRITAKALKEAIAWLLDKISQPQDITDTAEDSLSLGQLNPNTAKPLLDSAQYILRHVGSQTQENISLQQIRDFFANVAKLPFNGDAVISLGGAEQVSPDFKQVVTDVVATMGGTPDADGTTGATQKNITDFLAAVRDYLAWQRRGEIPADTTVTDLMPLGTDTPARYQLVSQANPRIQQFFKLSRLLAFDARIAGKTMGNDAKLTAFDPADTAQVDAFLKALPLAQPSADLRLPTDEAAINPDCRTLWNDLLSQVISPLLGHTPDALTPQNWESVLKAFKPYEEYVKDKKGAAVEQLPMDKLLTYEAQESQLLATTEQAVQKDKIVADINAAAKEVEKLLLLKAHLIRFANNFISFPDLYDKSRRAMFEMGSLIIDGRWFNLAFNVGNVAAHQALAKQSLLCILYVEVNPAPAPKYQVAVPVTFGSIGNLAVGKRGVFLDLDGREHDAKVTQLIVNPVCIREALLAPFVKMGKLVEGKIETWSNASEKNALADFNKAIAQPATIAAPPPKAPTDKQGMFLGASVAIAALGSAFAFISNSLSSMSSVALCITVLCALIALIAPLTIMAFIKLKKQDLSAMLEGCGWAINLRMKLTTGLRGQFTRYGTYPDQAKGTPKARGMWFALCVILLLAALAAAVKWISVNTEWGRQNTSGTSVQQTTAAKPAPAKPAPAKPAPAKPAPAKPGK